MSMSLANKSMNPDDNDLIPSDNDYLFTIDSSTPFFWFPEKICDSFAKALGLTYNETLQLYTYGSNSSRYDTIAGWDLNFTFTLSNLPDSSKSVQIELPFSALDHKLSYPFPDLASRPDGDGVRYFPLRKANDSRQYTIGRAFLQEAYLTVNYEQQNFSVSQAKFASDALTNMDIVEIAPYREGSRESSSLPTAAKAGIGVGVSVFVIILAVAVFFFLRRKKTPAAKDSGKSEKPCSRSSHDIVPCELQGDRRYANEAPADSSTARFELAGTSPAELPGSDVGELDSESREFKDSEVYRLHNGVPQGQDLGPTAGRTNTTGSDGVELLPPYSVTYMRPFDNSDSDQSSAFPSPLPGYLTSEGSHSFRVSPVTGSGEHSAGSFLQENQTSSSHQSGSHGAGAESGSPHNAERSVGRPEVDETSQQQGQAGSTPNPRRKFSWEE